MAISRGKNVTAWVLGGLLAFVYVLAGLSKLGLGPAETVAEVAENFTRYGHSAGFRTFIGVAEVAGAVGLLIPRLTSLAALGLAIIMSGAIHTHVTHQEGFLSPLVLLGLLALLGWLRHAQLVGRAA